MQLNTKNEKRTKIYILIRNIMGIIQYEYEKELMNLTYT